PCPFSPSSCRASRSPTGTSPATPRAPGRSGSPRIRRGGGDERPPPAPPDFRHHQPPGATMSPAGYQREQREQRGLKFYEKSHRYRLDGEWVPGVTTILGVLNKPALPKWSAKAVAEYVATNREAVEHLYAMGERGMVQALKEVPWT